MEERRWKDRGREILAVSGAGVPVKLFEASFEYRYNDPGTAVSAMNAAGKPVAVTTPDGSGVFLRGEGASAEGDKPFVAVMNLTNGSSKKIWESEKGYFEIPWDVMDAGPVKVLVRKESPTQSPNYYLWNGAGQALQQVTAFPSPYGNATLPTKQVLKYKRADGVELSANLYLPVGYKKDDGPLPTLMEAYPTEFKTKASAGQITGSPYEFTLLSLGVADPVCDARVRGAGEHEHSDYWRGKRGAERHVRGAIGGKAHRRRLTKARGWAWWTATAWR